LPYGLAAEPHENIPFLFVANVSQTGGNFVLFDKSDETVDVCVFGIDVFAKSNVASGVFVSVVHSGAVGKRSEIIERGVHLCSITFEETTAASDKEGITSEHCTWFVWLALVSDVVTDRILSVAWRCETSGGRV